MNRTHWLACTLSLLTMSCSGNEGGFTPFKAPLFEAYDLNSDSPTHSTLLELSDREGKVTALYFTSYGCSYCIAHFSALYDVFEELAEHDGSYPSLVQLWLMGRPIAGSKVVEFCNGTDAPCFVDSGTGRDSVYAAYNANLGQVFLVDKELIVRMRFDLVSCPMEQDDCNAPFIEAIRTLYQAVEP